MKKLHLAVYSAAAAILAAEFAVTAYFWRILPVSIPTHFNFAGTPDAYSEKTIIMVFLVPLIQLAIYLLMILLYRRPEYTSWPTSLALAALEEGKKEKVFGVLRSMTTWTLFWLSLFMAYIQFAILSTANGRTTGLATYVMVAMLAIMFLLIIVINVRMFLTVRKIIK